jgi:hypothetical protein
MSQKKIYQSRRNFLACLILLTAALFCYGATAASAAGYTFTGRVLDGEIGIEPPNSTPIGGVTINIYGSNNQGQLGTLLTSVQTTADGHYVISASNGYENYTIQEVNLPGYVDKGATSVGGTVVNANTIVFSWPFSGVDLTGNKFWDKSNNPPQEVWCCLPDGTVTLTTPTECSNLGGSSHSTQADAQNACTPPTPREWCCLPDGTVTQMVPADCINAGGASFANQADAQQKCSYFQVKLPDLIITDASCSLTPCQPLTSPGTTATLHVYRLGRYTSGIFNTGAAHDIAYDSARHLLFVANRNDRRVDILDFSNPAKMEKVSSIDIVPYQGRPNHVAVMNGIMAVAVESNDPQKNGFVLFFDTDGNYLAKFQAGPMPMTVTFTPDGHFVLTANAGKPNNSYSIDPEGSVTIIDIASGLSQATVKNATFSSFNSHKADLLAQGIRIVKADATVAQDLEPAYITCSKENGKIWISLPINNAVAELDAAGAAITTIYPLGLKDYGMPDNGIDASDKDQKINISSYSQLYGLYQPTSIEAFNINGEQYLISANAGESRNLPGFSEEAAVSELSLDPAVFPPIVKEDDELGRLMVTKTLGDSNNDGKYESLCTFGGRSFSIWKPQGTVMDLVYDSKKQLEEITANALPNFFNSAGDRNNSFDEQSNEKGPEPSAVAVGYVDCHHLAFIALRQIGGFAVFDISSPAAPRFLTYINPRLFDGNPATGTADDLGPKKLIFIPDGQGPISVPLLVVANEISGSVSVYEIILIDPQNVTGTINYKLENIGDDAASPTHYTSLTRTANGAQIGSEPVNTPLPAGGVYSGAIQATPGALMCDTPLRICADTHADPALTNKVTEWNENNNCFDFMCACGSGLRLGWCCAFGNLFMSTSTACATMSGSFFHDKNAAQAVCQVNPIVADIKINHADGPLAVLKNDPATMAIALTAGNYAGLNADWWFIEVTPSGQIFYLDIMNYPVMDWRPGIKTTFQGPLFDVPLVDFLKLSTKDPGKYVFYFAVDLIMNGTIDFDALYYDFIEMEVQ